jgi:hypothetical protein
MKTQPFTREFVAKEILYALWVLTKAPGLLSNEAPWVYINGLLAHSREEQEQSLSTNVKKWYILDFPELEAAL